MNAAVATLLLPVAPIAGAQGFAVRVAVSIAAVRVAITALAAALSLNILYPLALALEEGAVASAERLVPFTSSVTPS